MAVIKTASDTVRRRVNELRRKRGWSLRQLAERCADVGVDLSANALENIEYGRRKDGQLRRRNITVDELLALAYVLDVAPVHLLVPPDVPGKIAVTPNVDAHFLVARAWVRGNSPLPGQDSVAYHSEVPNEEYTRNVRLGRAGVFDRDSGSYVLLSQPEDDDPDSIEEGSRGEDQED